MMSANGADRLTWRVVRFNGQDGEAAYVDLDQIGAIADAPAPPGNLDVIRGAVICLKSGHTVRVKETADFVFGELHRYRCDAPPPAPRMKTGTEGPNHEPDVLPVTLSDAEIIGGPLPLKGKAGPP
jgi:hypothetical protein